MYLWIAPCNDEIHAGGLSKFFVAAFRMVQIGSDVDVSMLTAAMRHFPSGGITRFHSIFRYAGWAVRTVSREVVRICRPEIRSRSARPIRQI